MMRVRIDYLDHNEGFAQYLPVAGELTRPLVGADGRRWWVVELDHPLEYQRRVAEPFQFQLVRASAIVIGNRWEGHEVGEPEPTSVHILVPLTSAATQREAFQPDDFDAVAWGMCHTEAAA